MNIVRLTFLLLLIAGGTPRVSDLQAASTPPASGRTNAPGSIPVPPARSFPTNRSGLTPGMPAPGLPAPGLTNSPRPLPGATNVNKAVAPPTKIATPTNSVASSPGMMEKVTAALSHPYTYSAVIGLVLLVLLVVRSLSAKKPKPEPGSTAIAARRQTSGKVHVCNVLRSGADQNQLWQFDGTRFTPGRHHASGSGVLLPGGMVTKNWSSLYQRKLNIAWLPAETVFLRVLQLPQSSFEETVSMVELQLEKISPMPVAQVVWSIHVLPESSKDMQTVVVIIVARSIVEDFLGKLEANGFMADRLDLAALDQLLATPTRGDGAWIYPGLIGGHTGALVAWRYQGVLQNLDYIALPTEDRAKGLSEQLLQMAWAGELDGWLTSPPEWHLIADESTAAEWEPALREGLGQAVEVVPPVGDSHLASLTARRAVTHGEQGNLLPVEYTVRYHQQFVDRLWMRAAVAIAGVYVVGVAIYFIALSVASIQVGKVESQMAALGPTYTNALQLKARFEVLKERQELKYAALDCWNAVAGLLPETLTLDSFNFSDGRRLTLAGTAPNDQVAKLIDFEGAMRKASIGGQPLFEPTRGDNLSYHLNPAANLVTWNFSLELKRVEVQ